MKTYIEFETAGEVHDYIQSLNHTYAEFEVAMFDDGWVPFTLEAVKTLSAKWHRDTETDRIRAVISNVPVRPNSTITATPSEPEKPHAKLREQYDEDCLWYNQPWKFWEAMHNSEYTWEKLTNNPTWSEKWVYRRTTPTVTMPDGTILPKPVDKVPLGSDAFYSNHIGRYYRTRKDRAEAETYLRRVTNQMRDSMN